MGILRAHVFTGLAILVAALLMSPARAGNITILGQTTSNGYTFTNFDGPTPNTGGTTINGISNTGTVVGFTTDSANGNLANFTANPLVSTAATALNINGSVAAMANGINSVPTIVGAVPVNGVSESFTLSGGTLSTYIANSNAASPNTGVSSMAFGVNDHGAIVGQYTTSGGVTPGYILNGTTLTTINAPSGPNTVNAQGINNNGLVVGFYVGTDGQDHGFMFNASNAVNGVGTGVAIPDPKIIPQEPGATFVFSQILGINDQGIAVGYYGDSTTSQHGFILNTKTDQYTFLDNPKASFVNGVEVTQITGINNAGEITGFYTNATGAHGFVAQAIPEPSSLMLLGIGLGAVIGCTRLRRRPARTA